MRPLSPVLLAFPIVCLFLTSPPLTIPDSAVVRAVLASVVNGRPSGDVVALLSADDDVWIEAASLERAGVRTTAGRRQTVDDVSFVSLRSLAPDVTFTIDHELLALRLTVSPALLGMTVVEHRPPTASSGSPAAHSGFLSYAASWRERGGVGLFAEAGLSIRGRLLTTTVYNTPFGGFVRGLTQAVVDDRSRLNRWTIGDRIVNAGELGGAALVGGIALAREYGINPSIVRYPTVDLAGAVAVPSTIEVYANGQLVQRHDLPPGQFQMKGLPVSAGRGATHMVLRDVFGRRQEFDAPYYVTTSVLTKGLHDFTYAVGFERSGHMNWGYGRPVALARHRVGVTNRVTAGYRFEASDDLVSGGPSVTWRFGFGEVELAVGGSRQEQAGAGAAGVAGYRYVSRRLNAGAVFRTIGRSYLGIGSQFHREFAVREAEVSAGLTVASGTSLMIRHVESTSEGPFDGRRTSVTIASRQKGRTDVFCTVNMRGRGRPEISIGVTRAFGRRASARVSHDSPSGGRSATSVEVDRPLPAGDGYGYRARWIAGDPHASGQAEYQTGYGRYQASVGMAGTAGAASVSVSGGLVAIGGRVYATRSIPDAFALVRVPDMPGVRVYYSHQEIGRTDRHGNLLVPNLQSYLPNELSIADEDVPLMSAIEATDRVVAPPLRGGTVVLFPVRRIRAATGSIQVLTTSERVIPAFGQLTVRAGSVERSSPLGRNGEFYLEDLPPGPHLGVVEFAGRRCEFTFHMPSDGSGLRDDARPGSPKRSPASPVGEGIGQRDLGLLACYGLENPGAGR